jgi:putative alpha-1,2-mannosidase
MKNFPMSVVKFTRCAALVLLLALPWKNQAVAAESPVDCANPLVGTAPLDDPQLIGNAPPPGEEIYTGFTLPGPALPHHEVNLGPLNKDLAEAAGNHGIIWPYTHPRRMMIGFSSMVSEMTIMPLVGDWTVPPDRSYASAYDKNSEKASPGCYTVYFPDHKIKVELTTTERTGFYRFTFPQTDKGVVLIDLGPGDGHIEIIGDQAVRGQGRGGRCFIAEFSKPVQVVWHLPAKYPGAGRRAGSPG